MAQICCQGRAHLDDGPLCQLGPRMDISFGTRSVTLAETICQMRDQLTRERRKWRQRFLFLSFSPSSLLTFSMLVNQ